MEMQNKEEFQQNFFEKIPEPSNKPCWDSGLDCIIY